MSSLTNRFLSVTGSQTLGFRLKRYSWLFLAIAGLFVLLIIDAAVNEYGKRLHACVRTMRPYFKQFCCRLFVLFTSNLHTCSAIIKENIIVVDRFMIASFSQCKF